MKADLFQDIKGDFAFAGALKEHFLEGSAPLRGCSYLLLSILLWVNVPLQDNVHTKASAK